jgi:alkaline phosphatase D
MAWLKRALLNSRATWKVIASDMPLSIIVYDDGPNKKGSEAVAQGDGPPRGRELEIADLLRFIKTSGVANTVWLAADVHYAAAHYYNPDKAQFGEFDPFWEFVAGPLHAGTFGPNELDNTFGPELKFIKAPGPGNQNLPPSAGMQFFGHVRIEGASGQMTVTLRDRADVALWSTTLDPKPVQPSRPPRSLKACGCRRSSRAPAARRSNRAWVAAASPRTPPAASCRRHSR